MSAKVRVRPKAGGETVDMHRVDARECVTSGDYVYDSDPAEPQAAPSVATQPAEPQPDEEPGAAVSIGGEKAKRGKRLSAQTSRARSQRGASGRTKWH